jgi:hypothetical protein
MSSTRDEWVRASEVGRYAYCARAWWLQRVQGVQPHNVEALDRGLALHDAHGRSVAAAFRWRRWAYGLLALAILCLGVLLWHWVTSF